MNGQGLPPGEERDHLIAEYVLGVLTREERAQVEAMAARDPDVQAAITAWQSHFAGWLDELPKVTPRAQVWEAIDQQLFAASASKPPRRAGLWFNPRFWRWTSAALAACLLASLMTLVQPPQPTAPAMLARLEQDDGNTLFAATVQAGGQSVLFVPTRTTAWQNHSAQAWVIASDGKPHSLGLLPANTAAALALPADLATALTKDVVLAVTLEPLNGSPTGLPTGPVIAKGKLSAL